MPLLQVEVPIGLAGIGETALRLGAATLVGAAVGLNRELRGKPAGLRTHALVALGAAVVTLSSTHFAHAGAFPDGNAVTRAIQGVIAGVGFLGGGVILKTSDRATVRGLTTAASIWLVACIGITCGAGQWSIAILASALTLFVLVFGGPFEWWIRRHFGHPETAGRERRRARRTPARPDDAPAEG